MLVGISVAVGTSVGVSVAVAVAVGMSVGVSVAVAVSVAVGMSVGVSVMLAVAVSVRVGVSVGVSAASLLKLPPTVMTNCGALPPVRLEKLVCVLLVVAIARSYAPLPVTRAVTSTSVHVLATIAPELPKLLPRAGALLKLIVVSPHPPLVPYTV